MRHVIASGSPRVPLPRSATSLCRCFFSIITRQAIRSGDYPVQLQYSTWEVSIWAEVLGAASVPISADSFWSRQLMCS